MPTERLKPTEAACKNAPPNAKLWDTEIKGFGLFTGKTRKTFYYQKDVHGKTTRTKLGTYPEMRPAGARYETAQLVAQYATSAVARRLRAARIPTLEQATDDYLARPKLHSGHNKNQVRGQIHNHLTEWLPMPLDEITKDMCVKAHERIAKTGERGTNHVLKSLRSIHNHAWRTHDLSECPTIAIEWLPEAPSQRIITDLTEWKRVVDELENPIHTAFYLLLLTTGLRKTEALSLR